MTDEPEQDGPKQPTLRDSLRAQIYGKKIFPDFGNSEVLENIQAMTKAAAAE